MWQLPYNFSEHNIKNVLVKGQGIQDTFADLPLLLKYIYRVNCLYQNGLQIRFCYPIV